MVKTINFAIIGLMLILSLGFISANTLVTGITYNSDFTGTISDASITVECNSILLDTNSGNGTYLSDGTYAIIFDINCTADSTIKVIAKKGDLVGEATGIVSECNESGCIAELMAVINPNLIYVAPPTPNTNSGGGGGGHYYYCGNGVCDSGETTSTCAQDCYIDLNPINLSTDVNTSEELNITQNNSQEIIPEKRRGFTGAVVGVANTTVKYWWVIVLIGALIAVYIFMKKKGKWIYKKA